MLLLATALFAASPCAARDREVSASPADIVRSVELAAMRVLAALGRARRSGDEEASACLSPRLSELNAALRLASERLARARRAEDAGDASLGAREAAAIAVLAAQARRLEARALECIGAEQVRAADWTEVTVEVIPVGPDEERLRYAGLSARR